MRNLLLISTVITSIFSSSCDFGPEYGYVNFYIDKALFGNIVEFSHNGELLTESYLGFDELYMFTIDAAEAEVEIYYNFEKDGQLFSSTSGAGAPVVLDAPEGSSIPSNSLSYELRPTGLEETPFLIFDLNEDEGPTGGSSPCDLVNYNGPEFNTQIDAQCKTAYLYDCVGNEAGRAAACELYYSWDDGSPDFPDCPYCK